MSNPIEIVVQGPARNIMLCPMLDIRNERVVPVVRIRGSFSVNRRQYQIWGNSELLGDSLSIAPCQISTAHGNRPTQNQHEKLVTCFNMIIFRQISPNTLRMLCAASQALTYHELAIEYLIGNKSNESNARAKFRACLRNRRKCIKAFGLLWAAVMKSDTGLANLLDTV